MIIWLSVILRMSVCTVYQSRYVFFIIYYYNVCIYGLMEDLSELSFENTLQIHCLLQTHSNHDHDHHNPITTHTHRVSQQHSQKNRKKCWESFIIKALNEEDEKRRTKIKLLFSNTIELTERGKGLLLVITPEKKLQDRSSGGRQEKKQYWIGFFSSFNSNRESSAMSPLHRLPYTVIQLWCCTCIVQDIYGIKSVKKT